MLEGLLIGDSLIGAVLFVSASEVWNVSFVYFLFYRLTLFKMQMGLQMLFSYLLGWPRLLLQLSIRLKLGIAPKRPF